jgi:hypothetical protein
MKIKMRNKEMQMLLLSLLIIFQIALVSPSDSQLYQACGGDAQTTIACAGGDSQLSFSGYEQGPSSPPSLTVIKPVNQTYFNANSLKLQISTNADEAWYNLDDGENITIENSAYFDAGEGTHTLYVFANNSIGMTAKNITFTVDSRKFSINGTKFSGPKKGATTNFSEYSYEEIQNISDLTFEDTDYGKISFSQSINLTDDSTPEDSEIDLDSFINISSNLIEVNSTALPNFNKSAILYLYNLTFKNPRILRDGAVCPSEICTRLGYSGGILTFAVTGFTSYSSEETPESPPETAAKGGGGHAIKAECSSDNDCLSDETCLNGQCIKFFDVKITDFESPAKLGQFFSFTYYIKGMASIRQDVSVDFWIENSSGSRITSGSDVIYMGNFEEKTETAKMFLPKNVESGTYTFYVRVSYGAYAALSSRTIEIEVSNGMATIRPAGEGNIILYLAIIIAVLLLIIFRQMMRNKKTRKKWKLKIGRLVKMLEKKLPSTDVSKLLKSGKKKISRRMKKAPEKEKGEEPAGEAIEEAVEETEKKNRSRKTGDEMIEEIKKKSTQAKPENNEKKEALEKIPDKYDGDEYYDSVFKKK